MAVSANDSRVLELVSRLAEAVMSADGSDPASLAELQSIVAGLTEALGPGPGPVTTTALSDLRARLSDATGPSAGPEAIARLGAAAARLQEIVEDGEPAAGPPPADDDPFVFPDYVDEATRLEFLSNQKLVLEEIERHTLAWERGDDEALAELRRQIHTLKGEAGVLGLDDLERMCHALEDYLPHAADDVARADRVLAVIDWIARALASYGESRYPSPRWTEAARQHLDRNDATGAVVADRIDAAEPETATAPESKAAPAPPSPPPPTESTSSSATGRAATEAGPVGRDEETIGLIAEFLQEAGEGLTQADDVLMNAERQGIEPDSVNELFRTFHTIKGVAGFLEMTSIAELAHATETILNQARDGVKTLEGPRLDLVFEASSATRKMLDGVRNAVEQGTAFVTPPGHAVLLDQLRQAGGLEPAPAAPARPVAMGAPATAAAGLTAPPAVPAPREAPAPLRPAAPAPAADEAAPAGRGGAEDKARLQETVKVDLDRVDRLMELIGELVIMESMVAHAPEIARISSPIIRKHLSQLDKTTRDLQDIGMRMRMVPVRAVFQKMARMVRDLSRKSGKNVNLTMSGEWTEMDRSMVEQIADPLVHMIRNAVDHGIEPEADRRQAGKPPAGTVHLAAYYEGGSIVLDICDDGRGLDRDRIVEKARARGMIQDGDGLSEGDILNLILAPGFSTAPTITEISGRGVGMDVVHRNIKAMRGRIQVCSTPGQGTTFKIRLPLTLAIIDGMLVRSGQEHFIIPTLSIVESMKIQDAMHLRYAGRYELVNVRDEILPLVRLNRLLDIETDGADPSDGLVVIVEGAGRRVGLYIDDVVTQQQVVIKSLGSVLGDTAFVSGAAILSDGHVGLILNVEDICGALDDPALRGLTRSAAGRSNGPAPAAAAHH